MKHPVAGRRGLLFCLILAGCAPGESLKGALAFRGGSSTPSFIPRVNRDEGGWSVIVQNPGSRTLYVSSSTGNDAWEGTEERPFRTASRGLALMRSGFSDWLLFKRGDTFPGPLSIERLSGPSSGNAMMRVGAYGDWTAPRPKFETQFQGGLLVGPGYRGTEAITNLAITDLYFSDEGRLANPTSPNTTGQLGVFFVAIEFQGTGDPFSNILFENNRVSGYNFGVNAPVGSGFAFRRNIFDRLFIPSVVSGHTTGILTAVNGILIEENLFYLIQYPGFPSVTGEWSQFSHAGYIGAGARDVVTRYNTIIRAQEGIMQRAGGVYEFNVVIATRIWFLMGQSWGVEPTPGGVTIAVRGNLGIDAGSDAILGNTASGTVQDNLGLWSAQGAPQSLGFSLVGRNDTGLGVNIGVHNVQFSNNWLSGTFGYGGSQNDPQNFSGLNFAGNLLNRGQASFGLRDYLTHAQITGASTDPVQVYGEALLTRDRGTFDDRLSALSLINYVRGRVGLSTF